MEITIAVIITIFIVIAIMSKINNELRFEEACAEKIQDAFIQSGDPIELGIARLLLRDAVNIINKLNKNSDPVYLSLKKIRKIARNGILYSLETGQEPMDAVIHYYNQSRK